MAKYLPKGVPRKRIFSQDHRRKLSIAAKGKKPTEEVKRRRAASISRALKGKPKPWILGPKNPNWRGGYSEERNRIQHSAEYKLWRESVFVRDNYTCRFCGKHGGNLNADHIKPFALFPELRFAIDNGRTLCEECHRATPSYGVPFSKLKDKQNA